MAETKRVSRLAVWLETHPTIKIVTITSALFAFLFDLGYEFLRIRPLQEEERRGRFWEIVARPSPGNSGKTQAMQYLNGQGVSLHGIDQSCERHGGEWKKRRVASHISDVQECVGGVYLQRAMLSGVDLSTANLRGVWLDHAELSGADLAGANLRGARLVRANLQEASLARSTANAADFAFANMQGGNLEDADLFGSVLVGANLSFARMRSTNLGNASLFGANLQQADLTEARLSYANLQGANLANANLTGAKLGKANLALADVNAATFLGVQGLTQEQLEGAWAWQDTPPNDLPEGLQIARLCDPDEGSRRRKDYERLRSKVEASFANLQHCGPGKTLSTEDLPEELQNIPRAVKSRPTDSTTWITTWARKFRSLSPGSDEPSATDQLQPLP